MTHQEEEPLTTQRSYDDACGMAHALDLVGERWALLVVRELVVGPKRFSDLKADLRGISTNVLSDRLDELDRAGIVRRRRLPPPAASWVYEVTEWGAELEPIMRQIGRWGARSPAHRPDLPLSIASFVLSLRTNFDSGAAAGLNAEYQLHVAEDPFRARVRDGRFEVDHGAAERPAAVLEGLPEAFAAVIYGGRDLAEAITAGDLVIGGDQESASRFLGLFPLPAPALPPSNSPVNAEPQPSRS
jgi:DNA-binding HxlR family transcriptional regulator